MNTETCNQCGSVGAVWRLDPYLDEVWDEEIWIHVCDECWEARKDEV